MTSLVRTTAGSTLSVCVTTLPATYDSAGFGALTYVAVGEINDLGSLGPTYAVTKFMPLGTRTVVKRRGSVDPGTLSVKAGYTPTNAGQIAMLAALASDTSSSFKIVTQSGTIFYFTAQTSAAPIGLGTADQIATQDYTLDLDSLITFANVTA